VLHKPNVVYNLLSCSVAEQQSRRRRKVAKTGASGEAAEPLNEEEMADLLRAVAEHGDTALLAQCPLPFDGGDSKPLPTPARTRSRRPAPTSDDSSSEEV